MKLNTNVLQEKMNLISHKTQALSQVVQTVEPSQVLQLVHILTRMLQL